MKFDELIEINGQKLTKKYIQTLSMQERLDLIDPIFDLLRINGFMYPDWSEEKLRKSYQSLLDYQPDLNKIDQFNNSSCATDICKYFCHSFYSVTEKGKPTILEVFDDDVKLKKIIKNRLGCDWLESDGKGPGVNESFNLSFKMCIFQAARSMRLVPSISLFKPIIFKYIAMKYSEPGDTIFDYSCGFGGRLLGAASCGRKYIGTDPLTVPELEEMAKFFKLKDYKLIKSGSENYRGDENSIDLSVSSPPYLFQEWYSDDQSQACANGDDYFYNIYWKQTLENVKFMLKPNKWFGLNVKNVPRMLTMAEEVFGPVVEKVNLLTVRSHLNKTAGVLKDEYIYMFKNIK